MTLITIRPPYVDYLRDSNMDINAWMLTKGYTVEGRKREKCCWEITLTETLSSGQKAALVADLVVVLTPGISAD